METRLYLYQKFERFWHWAQAILIILLIISGFELHGLFELSGFYDAFTLHNYSAFLLAGLIIFAIFWDFTTGEWRQYIPSLEKIDAMVCFYTRDIFKGLPHPFEKTRVKKLNPLQRFTYFALKVFIFPFQLITGFLYFFYNNLAEMGYKLDLGILANLHSFGAYLFVCFLIVHVYLTTTGETPFSLIKAMITGYEDVKSH
jgi:thiosulfate reductase cytochrome b subunit